MENSKATCYTTLSYENNLCKFQIHGRGGDYFFNSTVCLQPKSNQYHMSPVIGQRFMKMIGESYAKIENIYSQPQVSNASHPLDYNIAPTTKPQHRVVLNSSTFHSHGAFEPSLRSSSMLQESHLLLLHKESRFLSLCYNYAYTSWLYAEEIELQVSLECNYYDLRTVQDVKPRVGRVWVFERTMARKLAHELEKLNGGSTKRFKGVRWRPERKHPWVAEFKLSRKKIWIGNFDSPEEAAQAYNVFSIRHQKQKSHNFDDSSMHVPKSIMKFTSTTHSEQHDATDLSYDVPSSIHPTMTFENGDVLMKPKLLNSAVMTMSMHHSSSQDCNARLDASNIVDSNPNNLEIGGSQISSLGQEGPCNSFLESVNDVVRKSYYMFANDLPIMVDKPSILNGMIGPMSSLQLSPMFDLQTNNTLLATNLGGEDHLSVNMTTRVD